MTTIQERLETFADHGGASMQDAQELASDASVAVSLLRSALKEAKGALAICDHPSAGGGDGLTIVRGGKPIGAIIDRALTL
jgi:hypothetical protein